jgi:hypothetical protein
MGNELDTLADATLLQQGENRLHRGPGLYAATNRRQCAVTELSQKRAQKERKL